MVLHDPPKEGQAPFDILGHLFTIKGGGAWSAAFQKKSSKKNKKKTRERENQKPQKNIWIPATDFAVKMRKA